MLFLLFFLYSFFFFLRSRVRDGQKKKNLIVILNSIRFFFKVLGFIMELREKSVLRFLRFHKKNSPFKPSARLLGRVKKN